ncbi:CsbD family protein [bacterium]|nr:MAG: CsbD family protein [bacterium]
MSQIEDKLRGAANETAGNIKQAVGKATDNEHLEAEGKAQEVKGEAQSTLGKAKEAIGNALENAADALKGSGR